MPGAMTTFGCLLSAEEYTPDQLIDQARLAERAGFTRLAVSDHYHPWIDAQGNASFVWSMIGALSQVTTLPVMTMVTCPGVRTHPAVVAQAAATSAVLTGGGFALGVGTGEALNEHVVGGPWPPWEIRAEMLQEAVEVIRALFTGRTVDHHGRHYTVENARLYTLPPTPPPIHVSGLGPKAARLAGRIGDGFIAMAPRSGAGVPGRLRRSRGEGHRRRERRGWPQTGHRRDEGLLGPGPRTRDRPRAPVVVLRRAAR